MGRFERATPEEAAMSDDPPFDRDLLDEFYLNTVGRLLEEGALCLEEPLLVPCGGPVDRANLMFLGFKNVTICNLDTRMTEESEFAPYHRDFENLEDLSYDDEQFAFCLVHSGLHHCRNPQRGLLEMYRVAARGVLAFEPNKSPLIGLGVKLGLGQQYEHAAVRWHNLEFGGVANTSIPNFVYRFDKELVKNTIQCAHPEADHTVRCWYSTHVPGRLRMLKSPFWRVVMRATGPVFTWAGKRFSVFANNIAFYVAKPQLPEQLMPWLKMVDGGIVPDPNWFDSHYNELQKSRPD